jgi:hypothetical protein
MHWRNKVSKSENTPRESGATQLDKGRLKPAHESGSHSKKAVKAAEKTAKKQSKNDEKTAKGKE